MTLLSRISGLIRDMLFTSHINGHRVAADAFYVAFRIPISASYPAKVRFPRAVPVFAEYKAKYTAEETRASWITWPACSA
jgi:peptidoglycan biosynthesis protein MviN/MurJ (putative lipid II flippase)